MMVMEATVAQRLQFSTWIDSEKVARRPSSSARCSQRLKEQNKLRVLVAAHLPHSRVSNRHRHVALEVSCSYDKFPASTVESGNFQTPFDESLVLKNKAQAIEPYLNGRCIYLVGMMGSGKTTVGKILSQAINYSFIDSDTLVEHEVGGTSVAEIFKHNGEGFFRDKETEVLRKLSLMHHLVVSTGGGAVVRPINWKCMKKGISVWLDVPLEALAQRIAAVGTGSRPLLHHESGDAYRKTFMRLTSLFEQRGDSYANASARVSLKNIAAKLGYRDVSSLTPTAIVIEVLEQIEVFLKEEDGHAHITF
ncbi:shikimate kinase chloroplastic [Prunus yedoensis var. nudiflora]|uniref:shikimate kinase n=1 Tax=Prunus yedoensis var. nudiflora TaxID=2094558 RepID=A0A314XHE1_PRUYE|nr:shikimate kinase chloroplastic [Prunus yedoensis var. nudiflora]